MDALNFLKEKGVILEGFTKFEIRFTDGKSFELTAIMEEFKERILNPKSEAQFKEADRVLLKNDSTGKRYRVVDYNPDTKQYLLHHPCDDYVRVKDSDVLPPIPENEEA